MAEAMAAGTVPVVADVGDLKDLVADGRNGYLVRPNCLEDYSERIVSLLKDDRLRLKLSRAAVKAASSYCSLDRISSLWREHLFKTIGQSC